MSTPRQSADDSSIWSHVSSTGCHAALDRRVVFFLRQMQSGGGKAWASAVARQAADERSGRVTFEDVAGVTEAKAI